MTKPIADLLYHPHALGKPVGGLVAKAKARLTPEAGLDPACRNGDGFPGNDAVFDLEEAREIKNPDPAPER